MATDQEPGQMRDVEYDPSAFQATGAEEAFNTALGQFQRGQLSTARLAFQEFLRVHPDDARVPDARFYLADILAQEERLDEAIQMFLEIPSLYPTAAKAPEAYYRVGVAYIAQDNLDDARAYLRRVVESYPDSDAAVLAQARLDEIG
jgi:tol-pal system protein YbgF